MSNQKTQTKLKKTNE